MPEALPAVTVPSGSDDRLQLRQRLQRRVRPRVLVGRDLERRALRSRDGDRDDLAGEQAGGRRRAGPLLAAQREAILIRAGDAVLGGDVLGGLGHRVDAVSRLHPRVDEAPAERGVGPAPGRGRRPRPAWPSRTAPATCSRRRRRSRATSRPPRSARAPAMQASRLDAHRRLTVAPGTRSGSPASSSAIRATLRLSSPAWFAQPRITSSSAPQSTDGLRACRARSGSAARSSVRTPASAPP